jgi:hypothetical protein
MGWKNNPQSESGRRNMSPRPSHLMPAQSLPPAKRNVLRAPRRRSPSVSSATTGTTLRDSIPPTPSTVGLGVDAELQNLSHQRDLVPFLTPQLAIDSPSTQGIRLFRPRTSSGLASPWLRPRSCSYSQQQSRSKRPATAPVSVAPTEENSIPTIGQLAEAASLFVIAESGVRVSFGDLFLERRTVVIFIRHFWCVQLLQPSRLRPDLLHF